MKSAARFLRLFGIGACLVGGMLSAPVVAGPAKYDKETKSFRFSYTFTNTAGAPNELGAIVKPSADQEDIVNQLVSAVSQTLFQATEGRAKISKLDYVDNAKDADLVVSLSPMPSSSGVSTLHAIGGNPGCIVLYYQTLVPYIRQDVINTTVHELSHYIFGLADEYNYSNFPNGCPADPSLKTAGCLMDNYFTSARNWMGRYCRDGEHNSTPTQPRSCQSIVDEFFQSQGVTEKDPTAAAGGGAGSGKETVIASTLGKVRAEMEKKIASSGGSPASAASGLAGFARKTLQALIKDFNSDNPGKVLFSSSQISKAVGLIVKASSILPITKPVGITAAVFELIKAEAKRLGEEHADVKTASSRFSKVQSGLKSFLKTLAAADQFAPEQFDKNEQNALVDRLAHTETRSQDEKALDQLASLSGVQLEYTQQMARWIVTILDEQEAPGTRSRLDQLAVLDAKSKSLGIPGRTYQGFGQRRSRFITPAPLEAQFTNVLTQGGAFAYNDLRDRGFNAFSRLINRERIELVTPQFTASTGPLDVRIDRPLEARSGNELQIIRQRTNTDLLAFVNETFSQLDRNRLENIAVLIPPGELPRELRSYLQTMKAKLRDDFDVRLDLILVGASSIPPELRDLSVRSHGSVLTITDIDEVGAIAQRLKNEQAWGAWVIVPQQSTIPQYNEAALPQFAASGNEPVVGSKDPIEIGGQIKSQITIRSYVVEAILKEARTVLDALIKQTPPISDVVKRQADTASANLAAFEVALKNLKAKIDSVDLTKTDEGTKRSNLEVLNLIVQARALLNSLEGSLVLASEATIVDSKLVTSIVNPETNTATTTFFARPDSLTRQEPLARLVGLAGAFFDPESKFFEQTPTTLKLDFPRYFDQMVKPGLLAGEKDLIAKLKDEVDKLRVEKLSRLERLKRFLRLYEKFYEIALLATKDNVPIYRKIDRTSLDLLRWQAEDAEIPGLNARKPNRFVGVGPDDVRLASFYVEPEGKPEDFNFELVVGLSRALPRVFDKVTRRLESKLPEMVLYSSVSGAIVGELKPEISTTDPDTVLVYRAVYPSRLTSGWYTPILKFDKEVMEQIKSDYNGINFTFSVASLRPNFQLIPSLKQPDGTTTRGTLHAADQLAVVQVMVSAGSPVRGAEVHGFYQKIIPGSADIVTQGIDFKDEGQAIPRGQAIKDQAQDGVYTATIPIADVSVPTEFRVFIQAGTTDGNAKFVELDDPNRYTPEPVEVQPLKAKAKKSTINQSRKALQDQAKKDQELVEGEAPKFQRATSIHFRVDP